jgi:hypothetical protein
MQVDGVNSLDELVNLLKEGPGFGDLAPGDEGEGESQDMSMDKGLSDLAEGLETARPSDDGMPGMDHESIEMCAMEECAGKPEHEKHEANADAASTGSTPAPGAPPMEMSAMTKEAAQKYVSRLERLYKNRVAKVKEDALKKLAEAEEISTKKVASKFLKTLKIAAKRQSLNLEESPLKAALYDVLVSEFDIDGDTFYPGMDNLTAATVIEKAASAGYEQFVDGLIKRAYDLMAMPDDALSAIEKDLGNLLPAPAIVGNNSKKANTKSETTRRAAVEGNLPVVSTSNVSETISVDSARNNIRSALGTTKVHRTAQTLLKK